MMPEEDRPKGWIDGWCAGGNFVWDYDPTVPDDEDDPNTDTDE